MADDVQDLPAPADMGGKASGGGNLIPLIMIIVLIPVINVAMFEFYLIPKMTAPAADAHAAADGHGDEEHGGPSHTFAINNVVTNLSQDLQNRFIKVSFTLVGHGAEFQHDMEVNEAAIRDISIGILSSLTLNDVSEAGASNIVRNRLLNSFVTNLGLDELETLHFTEFAVQ